MTISTLFVTLKKTLYESKGGSILNLTALNHFLTALSESEQHYKTGKTYEQWNDLEKTSVHEREVYIMTPSVHSPPLNNLPWNFEQNSFFSVKRNSRFNPVPEHIHSFVELNYVYSGACPQHIDQKPVLLKKNQVLLIDSGCPHSIDALGEDDVMISILISKLFLKNNLFSQFSKDSALSRFLIHAINEKTDHDHYLLFHSENNRRIPMFFREFFCEFFDPSVNSSDILNHLFYLIMAELVNVYENDFVKEESFAAAGQVAPVIRYIERNFRTCTLESVAQIFHLTPNYITTLLKKYTGYGYIQLIQNLKLDYAAKLLDGTRLSVTEAANEAGYENISFFYKKFYAHFGCSPKDYRKRH